MKFKNPILFALAFSFFSCGGSSENTDISKDTTNVSPDTTAVKTELGPAETKLPNTNCFSIFSDTYEVEEKLAEIKSTYNSGQILTVVLTTDAELFLEISYEGKGLEESWQIDIPVEGRFGFEVKLEYTDANHDDVADELVIWWSQSDGINGMLEGFEASSSGIIIFDVIQRNVMLNFVYDNHYSNYTAGKNANTNSDDYHAKMAEDSDWTTCSFYYTAALTNGQLILSGFHNDVEGDSECVITTYQEGTYRFNTTDERYEIVL